MAFQGNFSITQTNANTVVLADTSTGSDPNLTSRTVTITDYAGNLLTPVTTWAIANTTITFANLLTEDTAANIQVVWNSSNPLPDSTYTVSKADVFTWYDEDAYYGLVQQISANPNIMNDTVFFQNLLNLRVLIDSANQAIDWNSDLFSSQNCLNLAQIMVDNQDFYF